MAFQEEGAVCSKGLRLQQANLFEKKNSKGICVANAKRQRVSRRWNVMGNFVSSALGLDIC